jgi:hypothetical protein
MSLGSGRRGSNAERVSNGSAINAVAGPSVRRKHRGDVGGDILERQRSSCLQAEYPGTVVINEHACALIEIAITFKSTGSTCSYALAGPILHTFLATCACATPRAMLRRR